MSDLLSSLPTKEQLDSSLPSDFEAPGFSEIGTDVIDLTAGIDEKTPEAGAPIDMDVSIPADLSVDSVTNRLQAPLDAMKSVNADSISKSVSDSALPITPGVLSFDINTPMSSISDALVGEDGAATTPTVDPDMPGFSSQEALYQLKKLASAGQATPMRLVNMFLKIFKTTINTVTDQEQMLQMATESLEEIYLGQLIKMQYNLPYAASENMKTLLAGNFIDDYEAILDGIQASAGTIDFALLNQARNEILPALTDARRANTTLLNLSSNDLSDLENAIDHVLEFTGQAEVALQAFFLSFETKVIAVLDAVSGPVNLIKDGATIITTFLSDTAALAETAATNVAGTITDSLSAVNGFLDGDLTDAVEDINLKINAFLDSVTAQADTAVGGVKDGMAAVTDGVEAFFVRVNELKAQLETAVDNLAVQVDTKVEEGFELAEQKIRELLGKITEVLNSESVTTALNNTKEGIEKFKTLMEEVSLQPVFDIIVTKTGDVEIQVQSLPVDEMNTAGKTALKLASKVVKAVKVDEIVTPELVAIFKELRDPIAALVEELKKGVLQINKLVDEFAPGTIVKGLVENAGPYKDFINLLETYKPSMLLEPLKAANEKLTELVDQLDPDILIDKLQGLFNELYTLVDAISPAKLNTMIMAAVNSVTSELTNIREVTIDDIILHVKETISLEKLLEGTGIEEIANAEIWGLLKYYLGGEFLDEITTALSYVEGEIQGRVATLALTHHEAEVAKMTDLIDEQIAWTSSKVVTALTEIKNNLSAEMAKILALEIRRKQMIIDFGDIPEYKDILTRMELTPFTDLDTTIDAILATQSSIAPALVSFAAKLNEHRVALSTVDKVGLELAAPVIFRHQFSDPINAMVARIQAELAVYVDAVVAIELIITQLIELPAEMDADVALVLDAAADGIKTTITSSINLINTSASTITGTISGIHNTLIAILDKFSPYGLLNSFAAADYEEGGADFFRALLQAPTDDIAIFMSNKIQTEQLAFLAKESKWLAVVLEAMNEALFDPSLNAKKGIALAAIGLKIANLQAEESPDINLLSKYEALETQLLTQSGGTKFEKIRLNRVILEAMYPDQINMSIQSLHPFVVEQISRLYPQEVVDTLDAMYTGIVTQIKTAPTRLIQLPLDDTYNDLKTLFLSSFDIEGIFKVLQVKLDGMDEDLELGLDRVSFAFNHLVDAFDDKLSE